MIVVELSDGTFRYLRPLNKKLKYAIKCMVCGKVEIPKYQHQSNKRNGICFRRCSDCFINNKGVKGKNILNKVIKKVV